MPHGGGYRGGFQGRLAPVCPLAADLATNVESTAGCRLPPLGEAAPAFASRRAKPGRTMVASSGLAGQWRRQAVRSTCRSGCRGCRGRGASLRVPPHRVEGLTPAAPVDGLDEARSFGLVACPSRSSRELRRLFGRLSSRCTVSKGLVRRSGAIADRCSNRRPQSWLRHLPDAAPAGCSNSRTPTVDPVSLPRRRLQTTDLLSIGLRNRRRKARIVLECRPRIQGQIAQTRPSFILRAA